MKVVLKDTITKPLKTFSKGLPNIYNYILGEVGKDFATYTKVNYLQGQKMKKRTGVLFNSVKFFKEKDLRFGVASGVGVRGSLNYLNKFIGTKHEFFKPAVKAYRKSGSPERITERIVNDILRKKGL